MSTAAASPASPRADFVAGLVVTLPAIVAAVPFAVLLGALAAEKGLSPLETGLMSALVFAGSAQFVALDAWTTPPPWLLLAAVTLVVNLRHVFMGASLRRHLGRFPGAARILALLVMADEIWAFAEARAARQPLTPAFYAGVSVLFYASWVAGGVAGTAAGRLIADPYALGLDFAFVAIFIGLIMGFRHRPGFAATVAASAGTATLVHLVQPGPQSIAAGAAAGVAAAALAAGGRP